MEGMTMISFQNFSFRYEESKDFTLRGIDMTVRTGEFILLTGRSGCGKTTLIRSLNGLIPHFYPGEIKGDLLMDGHSLLEMKPSELAGQVGTVFQDPRSQFFMTDTTRELAFGCENLGLAREETIDRIARAVKELELVEYLNRSILRYPAEKNSRLRLALFMRLPQRSTSLMNHRPIWTMPPPNGLLKSWKSSRVPAIPFL